MANKDTRRNSAILSPKVAGSNPVMPVLKGSVDWSSNLRLPKLSKGLYITPQIKQASEGWGSKPQRRGAKKP